MMKAYCLILMMVLAPLPALAATFTATVDSNRIAAGEGFALQLSLSGAAARGDPDFAALRQSFDVMGQAQTSDTTIINGIVQSNVGWQLTLIPKQTGRVTVPAITIDTDAGALSTQPIALDVDGTAQRTPSPNSGPTVGSDHAGRDITMTAKASIADPYQNQAILYTVRIVAHAGVSDLHLGDVTADDAIVQPYGKMEVADAVENGVPVKVVDVRFIVTPLRAKTITIAPVTLQGTVERAAPVGRSGGMGNGFMDPFTMLRAMGNFPGFVQTTPFSISSNPVVLQVKPPAVAMDPWLPLHGLQIREDTDLSQGLKVGEPISRKFTVVADGVVGSQVPSLAAHLESPDFKVYADKPTISESVDRSNGDIIGQRDETYSVIPLKSGRLSLPAIRIPWWDIKNNRVAYAEVPAREITVQPGPVLPGTGQPGSAPPTPQVAVQAQATSPSLAPKPQVAVYRQTPLIWTGLLVVLAAALSAIAFVAVRLNRTSRGLEGTESPADRAAPGPGAPHERAEIRWDAIRTAADLNTALLTYAHQRWGTPRYAALELVFRQQMNTSLDAPGREEVEAIVRDLTAALYAGKTIDLETLKTRCRNMIAAINTPAPKKALENERLPHLNPS